MDKMPPSDIDAENIVLGSIFIEPTLIHRVKSVLDVKDFSSLRSREIFKAMAELSSANDIIDVITVVEKVYSNGRLTDKDSVVSAVNIVESSTFTAQAITHNLRIVKEKSALRNLVNLGETLNVRAMKEQEEPSHLITDVQKSVGEILSDLDGIKNKNEILCPEDCANLAMEQMDDRINNPGIQGVLTGFPTLDRTMRGLRRITVLSASTGKGKTTVGICIGCNIGIRQKIPTLYLNYEMGEGELLSRIQANLSGVTLDEIETGQFRNSNRMKLMDTIPMLTEGKLYISGNEPKTIDHTINLIHRYKQEANIQVVVIDYLGEVTPDKFKYENRESDYHTFSRIVQTIKDECSHLDINAIILSQLNREGHGGVPGLEKVAGSMDIARKANVFLVLGFDEQLKDRYGLASIPNYIKVDKNRAGRHPVTIPITFNGDCQKVEEADI